LFQLTLKKKGLSPRLKRTKTSAQKHPPPFAKLFFRR
jgi:hypothetical protein